MSDLSRRRYGDLFGPTVGDRVRLSDTELIVQVEQDLTLGSGWRRVRRPVRRARWTSSSRALSFWTTGAS
jgi:hypothetical protein